MKKIIILLALIGLILSGCEQIEKIEQIAFDEEEEITDYFCHQRATELIPSKAELHRSKIIKDFTWTDETTIGFRDKYDIVFEPGEEEGENINYLYSRRGYTSLKDYLTYSRGVVDETGTVIGKNTFDVKLVLQKTNEEKTFAVIDYEIVNCEWIG